MFFDLDVSLWCSPFYYFARFAGEKKLNSKNLSNLQWHHGSKHTNEYCNMRTVCWISFVALLWNVVNEQTNELVLAMEKCGWRDVWQLELSSIGKWMGWHCMVVSIVFERIGIDKMLCLLSELTSID